MKFIIGMILGIIGFILTMLWIFRKRSKKSQLEHPKTQQESSSETSKSERSETPPGYTRLPIEIRNMDEILEEQQKEWLEFTNHPEFTQRNPELLRQILKDNEIELKMWDNKTLLRRKEIEWARMKPNKKLRGYEEHFKDLLRQRHQKGQTFLKNNRFRAIIRTLTNKKIPYEVEDIILKYANLRGFSFYSMPEKYPMESTVKFAWYIFELTQHIHALLMIQWKNFSTLHEISNFITNYLDNELSFISKHFDATFGDLYSNPASFVTGQCWNHLMGQKVFLFHDLEPTFDVREWEYEGTEPQDLESWKYATNYRSAYWVMLGVLNKLRLEIPISLAYHYRDSLDKTPKIFEDIKSQVTALGTINNFLKSKEDVLFQ